MEAVENSQRMHADEYDAYVQKMNDRFNALTGPIFETDATGLYEAYLSSFADPAERQYHTCSCCRQFIERFGALATVNDDGTLQPAMWDADEAPEHYKRGVEAMNRLVRRAKITMPFLSSEGVYGTPISRVKATGFEWHHFGVKPATARIYRASKLKNAFQAASEKREEFGSVCHALADYSAESCATALTLLKNDQLGNSEAALGQAQFLVDLHAISNSAMSNLRSNLIFRAVATAPSGFCHPRSSMIATLLDDIQAGKSFAAAEAAWNAKMHPLRYLRPQAAPTAGNIAQAEKMFATLGLAPALKRRIARFEEVPKIWEPTVQPGAPEGEGVFSHLKAKGAESAGGAMSAPTIVITLEKFARTVVPTAEKMEVQLSSNEAFISITTAVESEAPNLFQWDHPFSWYVWHGGSSPSQFGLSTGWAKVAGITRLPARWNDEGDKKFEHHGDGIILLVDGARESRSAGVAIFPANLRAELREVRSTIESYSRSAKMEGLQDGSAIGIDLRKGNSSFATVRVTCEGRTQTYKIDRWD